MIVMAWRNLHSAFGRDRQHCRTAKQHCVSRLHFPCVSDADRRTAFEMNSVALIPLSPDVRIRSWNWRPTAEMYDSDEMTFLVPQSRDATATKFPLRPGDVLSIGGHTLSIDVVDDIQVESSVVGNADAAESQYLQSNGQPSLPGDEHSILTGISTPPLHPATGITIDETPIKGSKTKDAVDIIMSGVAKDAMQGNEDSQTWPHDIVLSKVLGIIGEESRRSQSDQSLPPSVPEKHGELKVESLGRVDPYICRSPSPGNTHRLKVSDSQIDAAANPIHAIAEADDETTDDEPIQEDTQTRDTNTNSAERMLDAVVSNERSPSPVGSPNPTGEATPTAAIDPPDSSAGKAGRADTEDATTSHYLRKGSKRTKIVAPSNEESQDSMKSAVELKQRPATRKSPLAKSPKKRTTPARQRSPVEPPLAGKISGTARVSAESTPSLKSTNLSGREESVGPTSSFRSTRSAARASLDNPQSPIAVMKVVFASSATVVKSKPFMKFLTSQGIRQVKDVADADILCVGKDAELKRTSNLITAVACGKHIVTDTWVVDSANQGKLLDPKDYGAEDPEREEEWGTTLSDAVRRGRQGVRALNDWTIHLTPNTKAKLGKGFSELKQICLQAGAKSVQVITPKKGPQELPRTLAIATEDDKDLELLRANGWHSYSKEIITYSILRGSLDLGSGEFSIEQPKVKPPHSASKKRKN